MDIDEFLEEDDNIETLEDRLNKAMQETAGEELIKKMIETWGDEKKARNWYFSESIPLGGKRPYDLCKEGKYKEVEQEVERIEHGICI